MDSNQVNRRKFFKGAGLVGLFATGYFGSRVVVEMQDQKPVEDISYLAPENNQHFVLMGNPKTNTTDPSKLGGGCYIIPNAEYQNKVEMSVGKDNMLWLKVGDEWKRVLTT